ncbi:MAG: hypothetical protein KGN16_23360 [Burkholderiales bacterium]|nr:hypothetical protein [Burkholderiales bacterium]
MAPLLPVIAFNLVNDGAALAGIGWRPFRWTTAIGIVSMTALTAVLGHGLPDMPPRVLVAVGLAFLSAGLAWYWIRRRRDARTRWGLIPSVRPLPGTGRGHRRNAP